MLLKTPGGNREMFGALDSSALIPRPSQHGSSMSYSGQRVDVERAAGLPAFLRALRLLCETPAEMPMRVFRGEEPEREPLPDAPQVAVLRRPNEDMTAYQMWAYVIACIIGGNALLWKVKVRGSVKALYPLIPGLATVRRKDGELIYEIRERLYGPVKKRVSKAEVIHIPGITLKDPSIGISLIEAHRHGLGTALARQEFEGRYLANDGHPGVVLKHEQSPTKEQRDEVREGYESRHTGPANAGRTGMLWGGWSLDRAAVSLADAQYVELQRFSVQDIARMTGVPSGMLDEPPGNKVGASTPEQDNMRLLTFGLSSWMVRLCQGLAADRDLFPDPDRHLEHDHSKLLRADVKTRFEAYRLARQGGWITGNEIRSKEGYESIEGGDELQQTPVGGAPNTETDPPPAS